MWGGAGGPRQIIEDNGPDEDWTGLAYFVVGISILLATERLSMNSGLDDGCEFFVVVVAGRIVDHCLCVCVFWRVVLRFFGLVVGGGGAGESRCCRCSLLDVGCWMSDGISLGRFMGVMSSV